MKLSRDIRWAEVRVGIFLVFALVLLAMGIFTVGEKTRLFVPKTRVQVLLANVQGLQRGAPVWLSGVVVGSVADIAFSSPLISDQITVTLEIETSAARRLGADARATIKTRGLLGEKYMDITPGTRGGIPEKPLVGFSSPTLDEVMAEARGSFERLGSLVEKMEAGQGTMGRLLQDPTLYDTLVQLAGRLEEVLRAMTRGPGSLAKMINDPRLFEEMQAFSREGGRAAEDLRKLIASWQDREGTLGKLLHDPALYDESLETVRRFRQSMDELDALLGKVREGEGTAGKLVSDAELYDRMTRTLKDLDALVEDMRKNPQRYVHFSLF